jgi:hypothetical protein
VSGFTADSFHMWDAPELVSRICGAAAPTPLDPITTAGQVGNMGICGNAAKYLVTIEMPVPPGIEASKSRACTGCCERHITDFRSRFQPYIVTIAPMPPEITIRPGALKILEGFDLTPYPPEYRSSLTSVEWISE